MDTIFDELQNLDELPEHYHYRDEGCELAPFCLECPFPCCIYEETRGKQRSIKERRNKEIRRLFSSGEWQISDLATRFQVSKRTVQRALAEQRKKK